MRNISLLGVFLSAIFYSYSICAASDQRIFKVEEVFSNTVIVDYGTREMPANKTELNILTIISGSKFVKAFLEKTDKKCEDICDEKECHFVGTYRIDGMEKKIQLPAAAVIGDQTIKSLKTISFKSSTLKTDDIIKQWSTPQYQENAFKKDYLYRWEWDEKKNIARLYSRYRDYANPNRYFEIAPSEYSVDNCKVSTLNTFLKLDCPSPTQNPSCGESWLYEGNKLILRSETDCYGAPKIEALCSFEINGTFHYLLIIGGKGSDYIGILRKTDKGWIFLSSIKEYATIC